MLARIEAWATAHPWWSVIIAAALFWLVTGLASWATYPDDPAEWERIKREEPRRAGVIMVLRGWGFYPAKVLRGLVAIVVGKLPPGPGSTVIRDAVAPPPAPPTTSKGGSARVRLKLGVAGIVVLVATLVGCPPSAAHAPREQARGYLAVMGYGVQRGVAACTVAAKTMKAAGNLEWRPLAEECANAYDVAETSLLAAEAALDAWQEGDEGKLVCAAGAALEGAQRMLQAMKVRAIPLGKSDELPVHDALRMASWVMRTFGGTGGECSTPAKKKDGGADAR